MITESDIKALRTSSSRLNRVVLLTAFPFGVVVFLVCGVVNFRLSARYAVAAGATMGEVMSGCFSGVSASQQYSGVFVKALERFSTGLMEVFAALYFASMMAIAWKFHKRNARILKFIEERSS